MKLNLGCGTDIRDNYVNVDLFSTDKRVTRGDFKNIPDKICPDGGAEHILAKQILQYVPGREFQTTVSGWCKKLASGGTIYIESIDATMLFTSVAYDQVTLENLNDLLYNGNPAPKGIYNIALVEDLLKKLGLIIQSKHYQGINFIIEAVKP